MFPSGTHNQIINKCFKFILSDAFLQNILIILHNRIDMQLHIEFLQTFILFEPKSRRVIFYINLNNFRNQFFYLLLMQNITDLTLHTYVLKKFKYFIIYRLHFQVIFYEICFVTLRYYCDYLFEQLYPSSYVSYSCSFAHVCCSF